MRSCAEHIPYQLPNKRSRVEYVLEAIECQDPLLLAAIANIEEDQDPDGKRNHFEAAVAYMLPKDPVAKRVSQQKSGSKRPNAQISGVAGGFGAKEGIGKSGVHL